MVRPDRTLTVVVDPSNVETADKSRAWVRNVRHTLDIDKVYQRIAVGELVTRLTMA